MFFPDGDASRLATRGISKAQGRISAASSISPPRTYSSSSAGKIVASLRVNHCRKSRIRPACIMARKFRDLIRCRRQIRHVHRREHGGKIKGKRRRLRSKPDARKTTGVHIHDIVLLRSVELRRFYLRSQHSRQNSWNSHEFVCKGALFL